MAGQSQTLTPHWQGHIDGEEMEARALCPKARPGSAEKELCSPGVRLAHADE